MVLGLVVVGAPTVRFAGAAVLDVHRGLRILGLARHIISEFDNFKLFFQSGRSTKLFHYDYCGSIP